MRISFIKTQRSALRKPVSLPEAPGAEEPGGQQVHEITKSRHDFAAEHHRLLRGCLVSVHGLGAAVLNLSAQRTSLL